MAEYIEKEAAVKIAAQYGYVDGKAPDIHSGVADMIASKLSVMPPADVAPVVHGAWTRHDDGVLTCSNCGNAESNDSYFCRYCGAKMDLEEYL